MPGYLSLCSNVMDIGFDKLMGRGNQSAAHELGHMFGLGHPSGSMSIMRGVLASGDPRLLGEQDTWALHWSVEAPRPGIQWTHRVVGPAVVTTERHRHTRYGEAQ